MLAFTSRLYNINLLVDEVETTFALVTVRGNIEVARGTLGEVMEEAKRRKVQLTEFGYKDWIVDDSEIYAAYVEILQKAVV